MKRIAEVLEFEVTEEFQGSRLDLFLSRVYPELSRTYLKKLIGEGLVYVEGEEVRKPSRKVKGGERVVLQVPEPEPLEVKPENIPIEILYEDRDVAVVVKPCGLVVHPSPGHTSGTLVNALLYHLKDLSSIGGRERPGIVHRLDKETAGLMVIAKNDEAHRHLVSQFASRRTEKLYRVLVQGVVGRDNFTVELPVGRHPVHRKKFSALTGRGKPAKSEFWTLERFTGAGVTLLRARIYTGRTHQIRVHLSAVGHPVLGDRVYGFRRRALPPRLNSLMGGCNMLVAYRLGFLHPKSGRYVVFEIEDPEPFRGVLHSLRELEGSLR